MDKLFIGLAVAAVVIIIAVILQIVWLRGKLGAYQTSNLTAQMTQLVSTQATQSTTQSSLQLYSIIVNNGLTAQLNDETSKDYSDLSDTFLPRSFTLPNVCSDNAMHVLDVSCNKGCFVVIQDNTGARNLINDIGKNKILYIVWNSQYYLIAHDSYVMQTFNAVFPQYSNNLVIVLYTVNPPDAVDNIPLHTYLHGCKVQLVPFAGSLSTDLATNTMNLTSTPLTPYHVLGLML